MSTRHSFFLTLGIALASLAFIVLWTNGPPCEEDASLCAITSETHS